MFWFSLMRLLALPPFTADMFFVIFTRIHIYTYICIPCSAAFLVWLFENVPLLFGHIMCALSNICISMCTSCVLIFFMCSYHAHLQMPLLLRHMNTHTMIGRTRYTTIYSYSASWTSRPPCPSTWTPSSSSTPAVRDTLPAIAAAGAVPKGGSRPNLF